MERQEMTSALETPSVIPRSEIPTSDAPHVGPLEVRPFEAHSVLGSVIPPSAVAMAWIKAAAGQDVAPRSHPSSGLLIVLQGRAELSGALCRPIEHGDVITLPSGHEYGFVRVGPEGLHALHVAFAAGDGEQAWLGNAMTVEGLLARNEARARETLDGPYFSMLRDGTLDSASKRDRYRDCVRVFSDAFQSFLLTRQATCRDEDYRSTFHTHLLEELGHNELVKGPGEKHIISDPVLKSTASWFSHQMLVLDNAGKAVVNLVLETAGYHFHTLAQPQFMGDAMERYFDTHAEDDAHHKDIGVALFQGLHPRTYAAMHRILEDAWNMFDALTRRIVELVDAAHERTP